MRGVARIRGSDAHRVRRWDVLMLGTALPGLVAAVRLGQRGARVLVLEEGVTARASPRLREPFVLTGADANGILGGCLRTLGLALIDQRRFVPEDVAVQVVLPDARIDFGRAAATAAELTAWGLAKPDEARTLVRALAESALAERNAMQSDAERAAHRRRRGEGEGAPPAFARGWPREAAEADAPLQELLRALTRGLSNLGRSAPPPEARARLVGGLLDGGAALGGGEPGLLTMLRKRAKDLFAEFRPLDRSFALVSVANQPGISLRDPDEVWTGRVMVLNAPLVGLRNAAEGSAPELLRGPEASGVRTLRHLRGPADVLPEGMGSRVICVPPTRSAGDDGDAPVVTLHRHGAGRGGEIDLVAAAVGPPDAPAGAMEAWIDRVVARLVPFAEGRLAVLPVPSPVWDTDTLLCDPPAGGGWPSPPSTRLSGRLPIHHLDRAPFAGLGFEGDLLLGLRAADAIAAELP